MASPSSDPPARERSDRQLATVLGILEVAAVILVLLSIILQPAVSRRPLGVGSDTLLLAGTVCLLTAPVAGLFHLALRFLSQQPRAAWYALGTIAVTVIGVLLAR